MQITKWFQPKFGKGAYPDPSDTRDHLYERPFGAPKVDWEKGYDIEEVLGFKIPFKNQALSLSCVGQSYAYYVAILNAIETGFYDETSAKAIYSQIFLPQGGSYLRDGAKLVVDWGSLVEMIISSYENGNPPREPFMRDRSWLTAQLAEMAKILQAKEYVSIPHLNSIENYASAIQDGYGVVGGFMGDDEGWRNENVKPPKSANWGHAVYLGKFGIDEHGKYLATPNSWGDRFNGKWQKIREDYFTGGNVFSPWTLIDKPNPLDASLQNLLKENEKKLVIEAEGVGRVGIVINGKLREVKDHRKPSASLYILANNGYGRFVSTNNFNSLPKDSNF